MMRDKLRRRDMKRRREGRQDEEGLGKATWDIRRQ